MSAKQQSYAVSSICPAGMGFRAVSLQCRSPTTAWQPVTEIGFV